MTIAGAPPTLLVSIINYRTGALTLDCVRSVIADIGTMAPETVAAEVVVVDNRSGDGSCEMIEAWIAAAAPAVPVRLIRSATNAGFSGGHNQGIAARAADFYLVLNSDALVRPGFFRALLDAAAGAPDAGLFAPRIEHDDGTPQVSCFRLHSPASELIRAAGSGPVTRALARHDVPLGIPPQAHEIGWASFACILMRGTMVRAIGPMDEGYFLYFEDTEYCMRARRAGWGILPVPEARVVHFRGGSGPVKALARARARLPGYYYASRTRFLYQAHGWGGLVAANLLWHLGRGLAGLRWLAGRPVPPSNRCEARDIWTHVFAPLRPWPRGEG